MDLDFVLNKSASASTNPSPILEDEVPKYEDLDFENSLMSSQTQARSKPQKTLSSNPLLDFDNLNDCVEALLKKTKGENGSARDIKRR